MTRFARQPRLLLQRTRLRSIALLYVAMMLTVSHPQANDLSQFEALLADLEAAVELADVERWLSAFASQAIVMPPTSPPVRGLDAIRALYEPAFSGYSAIAVDYQLEDVQWEGNLATIHYSGRSTLTRETGDSYETKTHYVDILQRQPDGSWLISLHAWSRY